MTGLARALLLALVRLVVGAHPVWQGCAPEARQRIYFANHTSHLDTVTIIAALPPALRRRTHPVAALDYWGNAKFKRYVALACLNAVLVDRSVRQARDPLEPLGALLERGDSLIIFPEGTRGSGDIAPFKSGLYHLARRFPAVELVPIYLDNLYRIMPKGAFLPLPLICTPRIGAPLVLASGEARAAFLDRARTALESLARPRRLGSVRKEASA